MTSHPPAPSSRVRASQVADGLIKYTTGNIALFIATIVVLCVVVVALNFWLEPPWVYILIFVTMAFVAAMEAIIQKRSPLRPRRKDPISSTATQSTWPDRMGYALLIFMPVIANMLHEVFGATVSILISLPLLLISAWYSVGRSDSEFVLRPVRLTATDSQDMSPRARVLGALESAGVLADSALRPYDHPAYPRAPEYVPGNNMIFTDLLPKVTRLSDDTVTDELNQLRDDGLITVRRYSEGWTAKVRLRFVAAAVVRSETDTAAT